MSIRGYIYGLIVLEAEHFDASVVAESGISWVFDNRTIGFGGETTAFSGDGAMVTTPNVGVNLANDYKVGPHLDFLVRFSSAGTHYLWLRGVGDSRPGPTENDSAFVGLDGNVVIREDGFRAFFHRAAVTSGPTSPKRPQHHSRSQAREII